MRRNTMSNEEDNNEFKKNCTNMSDKKAIIDGHPNGDIGFTSGNRSDICDDNTGSEGMADGSGSDDCGDKMATESDPLQPKMVKSKSSNKIKEPKEVSYVYQIVVLSILWSLSTMFLSLLIIILTIS